MPLNPRRPIPSYPWRRRRAAQALKQLADAKMQQAVRPSELIPRGLSNIIFPDAKMTDRDPGAF